MANETRKPKIGDLVKAIGHPGAFYVMKVDDKTRTADIQLIRTGEIFHYAPWMALSYATTKPGPPKTQWS